MTRNCRLLIAFFLTIFMTTLTVSVILPPKLQKGDKVAIVAPSGALTMAQRSTLQRSIFLLQNQAGLEVVLGRNLYQNSTHLGGFAGTDQMRYSDFQEALESPTIKAILCARGGYGAIRMVDKINWDRMNPSKWVVGYSDITTLLLQMQKKLGAPASIHADMPATGWGHLANFETLRDLMFQHRLPPMKASGNIGNRVGTAKGKLTGGNLSLVVTTLGSSDEIDTDGKILFLEDIGENLYSVDRMLRKLERAKKFNRLAGLLVGQFTNCPPDGYFPSNHVEVFRQLLETIEWKFPVAFGMPFGHESVNLPMPLGIEAEMEVTQNQTTVQFFLN